MNVFEQMQELWEGDMALTVAKSLPAGLHLSNTLTGEMITGGMCGGVEDNCIIIDGCDTFLQMMRSPCTLQGFTQTPTCLCGTAKR